MKPINKDEKEQILNAKQMYSEEQESEFTADEPQNDQDEQCGFKPESRRDLRALAFHLVYAVDRFDYTVSLDEIVQNFSEGFELDIPHDSMAFKLAQDTINTREQLDQEIKPLLKNWKLERLGCCTKLILRLALCELHQEDAIANIVINEAIELAKAFAEKDAYKFINGILDEACKKTDGFTKKEDKEILNDQSEYSNKDSK